MRSRGRKAPILPESEQSQWDREMWLRIGMAIGQWLIDGQTNLSRPLHSLRREERAASLSTGCRFCLKATR